MKVLVADDSNLYRTTLRNLLEKWGHEVVIALDGHEAQQILDRADAPPLALLDWVMPGMSGPELCQMVRSRKEPYVYIILVTANRKQADFIKAFEMGADDYVQKPLNELELRARLKAGERIIATHQELIDTREALRFEATHDATVCLWNRRAIIDLLEKELSRATRLKMPLSIFLADLDCFKRINDTHGHLVGDDVLRGAAQRMTNAVRRYDHVGRFGGEEFLVVLPNCSTGVAREVAERVRKRVADEPIVRVPVPIEVTASVGVAEWHGQPALDLLREADAAMYRAKQNGRNRVEVAASSSGTNTAEQRL
jgi:two-component system, cell cycle response regulator